MISTNYLLYTKIQDGSWEFSNMFSTKSSVKKYIAFLRNGPLGGGYMFRVKTTKGKVLKSIK